MLSIIFACLLFLMGCSAPHDNPLDPNSKRYVAPRPVPEFTARVWSEHFPVGQVSEIYQVRTQFINPDTSFGLDSAWVVYDGWLPRSLGSDSTGQIWGRNLDWTVFGCGQQMACVMGEPFTFFARGQTGDLYTIGPRYLFRVISTVPTTAEPDSFDTVGPHVALEWDPYVSSFGNGYGFRAALMDNADSTLWTSSLLARDQLVAYPALDSLADGSYYWTISVVDSFGNFARSQKAYFNVLQGGIPQ